MEKRSGARATKEKENATTKKPRMLRKAPMATKEQQQDEGEKHRTLSVILDLDTCRYKSLYRMLVPDLGISSSKLNTLNIPLDGQPCKNGHAACEACCARTHRVCPSCIEPIGDIRCRPLENAIAGMLVPCAFAEHGCTRRLRFAEKPVHEALLCQHAPCACPVPGCAYAGLELRDHIQDAHAAAGDGDDNDNDVVSFAGSAAVTLRRGTPFRVLLHETDGRVFLLLNGGGVPSGRSLSVVCVGPRPGGNRSLEYTLQVGGSGGGEPGALALSASGPVPCTRLWAGHHPTETFLFVPDAYWGSSGSLNVTIHFQCGMWISLPWMLIT
ncbi:putative E3 ubiquitin-protein ligase SINA-like 6 [Panicum hallii]|uniref:putative E3 ubiquitin-protein ligase SINA-like 6 n=1 Tax=Panicum hallii TaxID=206008 RepID=UPI000DF4CB65|nr:putative E3 ubiquitin-protein ligase SINA-like 6 [Panicum hallii]